MSDLEPITQEETAWASGDLEPVTRKEQYLNRLTGEEQAIPETPITRTEQYLAKLCGEETEIPSSPITREEAYLAYLNGEDVTLPEPITRLEQFMAYAAEKSETKPTPLTREEFYWDKYQGGEVLKDFPGLPSSIVTVTDALAKPLDSLKVAITPIQSGSGDPSPDNIRPISGWTGAKIYRTGTNVWDEEWNLKGINAVTGAVGNWNDRIASKNFIPATSLTTYYLAVPSYSWYIHCYDINKNWLGRATTRNGEGYVNRGDSFTTLQNTKYIKFSCTNNTYGTTYNNDISINYPSTDTEYHAYTGQDYTITFPSEAGTVYGGTLDVVNGVLTVTDAVVDLGTLTWTKAQYREHAFAYASFASASNGSLDVAATNVLCSAQPIIKRSKLYNGNNGIAAESIAIYVYINTLDNASSVGSDYNNALDGTQFVYPLATPQTYQLTPTEVQMLLGTNNIWADTGDILEGKYWSKNPVTVTRAMLNTVRDTGEITEITPEEPEESDER